MVMSIAPGGGLLLRFPDGRVEQFATLRDAHRAACASELDLLVEDEVYEVHGEQRARRGRLSLRYPADRGKGHAVLVLSHTDEDRHSALRGAYQDFLELAEAYAGDPGDFLKAWRFIDHHPTFWTAQRIDEDPWTWSTSGYCSRIDQEVWREGEQFGHGGVGPVLVSLRAGGHVPEDSGRGTRYKDHYADWRLEVTALTFEKAILLLAQRVALCFERDGTPKPDEEVGLDEPKWVREVKSRIADLDVGDDPE